MQNHKNRAQRIALVGGLLAMAGTAAQAQTLTNTVTTMYSGLTGNYTGVFDGLLSIGIVILTASVVFALIKSMLPHRVRVK